jgi:hypothetical protein
MSGNGDPAPEDAARMRARVEGARRQIASSLVGLREEANLALSWREWFRGNPGLFLGVAFAVGFLAGGAPRR